jgi:multiple sugar transport system permease protein
MLAVILPTVWKSFPFFAITILAALQAIPAELYEAAKVDGARAWHQFRYVTWPSIKRPASARGAARTRCGPSASSTSSTRRPAAGRQGATETLGILVYREAFGSFRFGTAAALWRADAA